MTLPILKWLSYHGPLAYIQSCLRVTVVIAIVMTIANLCLQVRPIPSNSDDTLADDVIIRKETSVSVHEVNPLEGSADIQPTCTHGSILSMETLNLCPSTSWCRVVIVIIEWCMRTCSLISIFSGFRAWWQVSCTRQKDQEKFRLLQANGVCCISLSSTISWRNSQLR